MTTATPIVPHDLYLMEEIFFDPERIRRIRDIWQEMVEYLEYLLDRFMNDLPADYRNRGLPYQPDIVWGTRVIPNFRSTLAWLNRCYIERLNNDFSCYISFSLRASTQGQREFSPDWMDEVEPQAAAKYQYLLFKAAGLAAAIEHTVQQWAPGDLDQYFAVIGSPSSFEYDTPMPPPLSYPVYRLNHNITMKTGEEIPQTGFYLPDLPDSYPRPHVKGRIAVPTRIPENDPRYPGSRTLAPCTWTLIERVSDTGSEESLDKVYSVRAGEMATRSGYWFTLSQQNSRHYVKKGEILPMVKDPVWGEAYWQFEGD